MRFPIPPMDKGPVAVAFDEALREADADRVRRREGYAAALSRAAHLLGCIGVPVVRPQSLLRRLLGLPPRVDTAWVRVDAVPGEGRIVARWGRYSRAETHSCVGDTIRIEEHVAGINPKDPIPDFALRCARDAAKHTSEVLARFPHLRDAA